MGYVEEKITQRLVDFEGAFVENCASWEKENEGKWQHMVKEIKKRKMK